MTQGLEGFKGALGASTPVLPECDLLRNPEQLTSPPILHGDEIQGSLDAQEEK